MKRLLRKAWGAAGSLGVAVALVVALPCIFFAGMVMDAFDRLVALVRGGRGR